MGGFQVYMSNRSKRIKKWDIDIEDIVLGIILNLLISILVMLISLKIILIL